MYFIALFWGVFATIPTFKNIDTIIWYGSVGSFLCFFISVIFVWNYAYMNYVYYLVCLLLSKVKSNDHINHDAHFGEPYSGGFTIISIPETIPTFINPNFRTLPF